MLVIHSGNRLALRANRKLPAQRFSPGRDRCHTSKRTYKTAYGTFHANVHRRLAEILKIRSSHGPDYCMGWSRLLHGMVPITARDGPDHCTGWSRLLHGMVPITARDGPYYCTGWSRLLHGMVPITARDGPDYCT
ncbi:MAG: hypothetical protein WCK35_18845, partial [Chloroflexota bacterium]